MRTAVVTVNLEDLNTIATDPDFGKTLADAIRQNASRPPNIQEVVPVSARSRTHSIAVAPRAATVAYVTNEADSIGYTYTYEEFVLTVSKGVSPPQPSEDNLLHFPPPST